MKTTTDARFAKPALRGATRTLQPATLVCLGLLLAVLTLALRIVSLL